MTITITLPSSISRPKNVKDAVMNIIARENSLTLKKIYFKIKKMGLDVSYQATHKALSELVRDSIIDKKVNGYSINDSYMDNLSDFIGQIRNNSLTDLSELPSILELETIHDVDKLLLELSEILVSDNCGNGEKKRDEYLFWSHFWAPLFLDKDTYKRIIDISQKTNIFFLTRNDTPVDRWFQKMWDNTQIIKTDIAPSTDIADFAILGDYVVQIFYPKEIRKGLDKVLHSAKTVFDIDINSLFDLVFCKRNNIPVLIIKNEMIANQLKEKIKHHFKNH